VSERLNRRTPLLLLLVGLWFSGVTDASGLPKTSDSLRDGEKPNQLLLLLLLSLFLARSRSVGRELI